MPVANRDGDASIMGLPGSRAVADKQGMEFVGQLGLSVGLTKKIAALRAAPEMCQVRFGITRGKQYDEIGVLLEGFPREIDAALTAR